LHDHHHPNPEIRKNTSFIPHEISLIFLIAAAAAAAAAVAGLNCEEMDTSNS
jgi:hypothetical protein